MLGIINGLLGTTIATVGVLGVVSNVNLCRVLKALRAFLLSFLLLVFSEIIK